VDPKETIQGKGKKERLLLSTQTQLTGKTQEPGGKEMRGIVGVSISPKRKKKKKWGSATCPLVAKKSDSC